MRNFDVNSMVIDVEVLNDIVDKKRQTVNAEVFEYAELNNEYSKDLFKSRNGSVKGGRGLTRHERLVIEQKIKRIDEDIVLLNNIYDISRYGVHGSGFSLFVKRVIWKITRIILKPLVSSISYYNYHVKKTLSDIKSVLENAYADN